jgi:hypothetical protein
MNIPALLLRCVNVNKNNQAIVDAQANYTYADILQVAAYIQTLSKSSLPVGVISAPCANRPMTPLLKWMRVL